MTVFATLFFRPREYGDDERLPILLKRELSQRVHRLDAPQPIKKTDWPAATTFYAS